MDKVATTFDADAADGSNVKRIFMLHTRHGPSFISIQVFGVFFSLFSKLVDVGRVAM